MVLVPPYKLPNLEPLEIINTLSPLQLGITKSNTPIHSCAATDGIQSEMVRIGIRDFKLLRCSRTSSREEEEISLDSLPSHLVVEEILARIPAQVIWDSTSCVCRKWRQMTHDKNFLFANLHHSTPGLLFRSLMKSNAYFITQANGQIAIPRLKYKFEFNIWSSCNGLILEYKFGSPLIHLRITNPVINRRFNLPRFILSAKPDTRSAIAYVANYYKVVHTYNSEDDQQESKHNACAILTVGVDTSWRIVDTHHLSLDTREQFGTTPFVTGGFVHWANNDGGINERAIFERKDGNISSDRHKINKKYYVLTLNVETEKITLYPAPSCNGKYYFKYLNSGGGDLSLLIGSGYLKWDVWEMKADTGEWTKLPCSIDLEARKDLLNIQLYDTEERVLGEGPFKVVEGDINLTPGGWLKCREVIIFNVHLPIVNNKFLLTRLRVVYNLQTQDITLFALLDYNLASYAVHCPSLITC